MWHKAPMRRPLPTDAEAREILARRRTRPPYRAAPAAAKALAPLIRKLDEQFGRGASALEPRWKEIVGEQLARVTQPQKLIKGKGGSPGVLELRVAGPAALLVQHQSADILSRVNLFLGAGTVDRLRIAQGPQRPTAAAPARPPRRPPPVLPAHEQAELDASLAEAPEALRETLARLGKAILSDRDTPRR